MKAFEYEQFFTFARTHWWFLGTRRIICDAVAAAAPPGSRARVLDVGCGAGNVLETLGPRFARYGVDAAAGALEVCRRHVGAPVCQGDATALPFADGAFDVVVATDVFEHVEDDARAVRECVRVCRPGGACIAAVPAYPLLYGPHDRQLEHHRRYRRRAFLELLRRAGLAIQRATYYNTLLLPPVAAVRLAERAFVRHPEAYTINYGRGGGGLIGRLMLGCLMLERWWLRRANLPAGVSVLAVAIRPAP